MDTLSNPVATEPEPPLTEAAQAALRDDVLSRLGAMPFEPGARVSRILWLILIRRWGFRNPVVLPVDDRLDLPEAPADRRRGASAPFVAFAPGD